MALGVSQPIGIAERREGLGGKSARDVETLAAGQAPGGHKPAAQWNLIEIDGESGGWRIRVERRGVSGVASHVHEVEAFALPATAMA